MSYSGDQPRTCLAFSITIGCLAERGLAGHDFYLQFRQQFFRVATRSSNLMTTPVPILSVTGSFSGVVAALSRARPRSL